MKLIRALRRFFAPGAADEIWAFFRPKLLTMHPDFQEVKYHLTGILARIRE